ncbi:hypothetical protein Hanom_Chr00s001737g01687351 [Helianthus anomalus]
MIGIGAIGEVWLPCPFLQSPSLLMLFFMLDVFHKSETLASIVILVIEDGN